MSELTRRVTQDTLLTNQDSAQNHINHNVEVSKSADQTKEVIFRMYQIIWYILGLVEVLLGLRMMLLLFGANSLMSFTNFIYKVSDPLATPFAGIFGVTRSSESVFEWSTLIAMAVYALIAYGVISLFQLVKPTNKAEIENTIDNQ